jgi:aminoglycoside 2''-phosphotransferase
VFADRLVFRFPKTPEAQRQIPRELAVLSHLRGRISVRIPEPVRVESDVLVYPQVQGQALDWSVLGGLESKDRQGLARQVGAFLSELHGSELTPDLPVTGAPVTHDAQVVRWREVEREVYPLLMAHQRRYADSVRALLDDPSWFSFEPRLIHGDLGPYHLLVNPTGQELLGVIDFGTAGVGDPANDISCLLLNYGETFVREMAETYSPTENLLRRARFLARTLELEWAARGLKTGEHFWFTAHLGNARDLEF